MSYTPKVTNSNVMQQGGLAFPWVAGWTDVVAATNSGNTDYDLAAARTAMGLGATEALFVVFSATSGFWCNFHNTVAIPVASTTNGAAPEFSPNQRYLDASITKLSLISNGASAIISLQFYRP